jgi:hypothetical protein
MFMCLLLVLLALAFLSGSLLLHLYLHPRLVLKRRRARNPTLSEVLFVRTY